MDIAYIMEFAHLADTLSFKNTADHFYVSRSVISRHLASLEEQLGVRLVERSNQSVTLTEEGKVFYRDAAILLRDYDIALEHLAAAREAQGKIVHVGYLRNAARPVIVRFCKIMAKEHPEFKVSLTCMEHGALQRSIAEGTVDIALAVNIAPALSKNYRSTPIYEDRFFAVMDKDHPLAAHTGGIALDELSGDKLLLPDSFVYSGLSEFIDGIVKRKSQLVAREYYRDLDMLYLKVMTEGYVAFSTGLNNAMFGDQLAILPVLGINSAITVSAFYRNGFGGPAFEASLQAIEACSRNLPAALVPLSLDTVF